MRWRVVAAGVVEAVGAVAVADVVEAVGLAGVAGARLWPARQSKLWWVSVAVTLTRKRRAPSVPGSRARTVPGWARKPSWVSSARMRAIAGTGVEDAAYGEPSHRDDAAEQRRQQDTGDRVLPEQDDGQPAERGGTVEELRYWERLNPRMVTAATPTASWTCIGVAPPTAWATAESWK